MKYQTNAVGHRVGASELPTRHPRHKPRRRFPLSASLVVASKLLQDISLFLFFLSLLLYLSCSSIADTSTFPSSSSPHPFLLLRLLLILQRLTFLCRAHLHLPFTYFSFPCPIEQSPHFFLMFSSLCLKITSLKTPGRISVASRILDGM